jgi:hypothetical protein
VLGVLVQVLPGFVDDLMQVHEVGIWRQFVQQGSFVGFFGHLDTRWVLVAGRARGMELAELMKKQATRYMAQQAESRNRNKAFGEGRGGEARGRDIKPHCMSGQPGR